MPRYVVLLRGVNVGRGRRVPMADLRHVLADLGGERVRTLLNSGNAVVDLPARPARTANRVAEQVRQGLAARLDVQVPTIVRREADFRAAVAGSPLAGVVTDPSRLLLAFAADAAALQGLAPLAAMAGPGEQLAIGPHAAYLHCPAGIRDGGLGPAVLGPAGRLVTTRNWATTLKLAALLDEDRD